MTTSIRSALLVLLSASACDGVTAGDDAGASERSAGCGMELGLATGEWIEQNVDVAGSPRPYWLWLPPGYDPSRSYPIVYQWHGCSDGDGRQNNNPPVERESGADAIHVRGRALASCWDTSTTGPDVAYFDALRPAVEGRVCADTGRRFATGYSSGAFMTHALACARGDQLRGVASIAGGQGGAGCAGSVAALLIHDTDDGTVNISASEGARDAHVERNGCGATRTPTEPSPCEAYACDADLPVVWCQTSGRGHDRQDALAAPAFWSFLSSLPR
jgi:polyhydroxybutyrate depolymerase